MGATRDAVTEPGGADWVDDPVALGATMGRYQLRRVVGSGGMGVVFEALDPELARSVAVKVLRSPTGDAEGEARLRREGQSMAQLAHPNVIRVYDVGVAHGHAFVAMEFVAGTTLSGWLEAAPRTPAEILAVFAQAGRGLAAAHAIGLVHRDFKPGNVMVGDDGRVLVTDFGLARIAEASTGAGPAAAAPDAAAAAAAARPMALAAATVTVTGQFVGTPAYMAPEQYSASPVDARADQFGFCVAAWRALFGAPPFAGDTLDELIAAAEAGRIEPPPDDAVSRVTAAQRAALERGMAGRPSARFPAMTELLAALEPAASARPAAPRIAARLALVVAAALAGGAAVWAVARSSGGAAPPDARPVVATLAVDAAALAPVDAPPTPPPPDARPPDARPPDAAGKRRPHTPPDPRRETEPDPPDDFSADTTLVDRGLWPIMRASARCGRWTDHEYQGELDVDEKGVTSNVVVRGPDPVLVACMTAIAQRQRFPRTKFGGGHVSFEFMRR